MLPNDMSHLAPLNGVSHLVLLNGVSHLGHSNHLVHSSHLVDGLMGLLHAMMGGLFSAMTTAQLLSIESFPMSQRRGWPCLSAVYCHPLRPTGTLDD